MGTRWVLAVVAALLLSSFGCTAPSVENRARAHWQIEHNRVNYGMQFYWAENQPKVESYGVRFVDIETGQEILISGDVEVRAYP